MPPQSRSKRLSEGNSGEGGNEGHCGKFQGLQAGKDLEANWEVDVAEKLEEYLLKICSGVVCSSEDVNFAEAALLLQGSAQVYSRKVEYLYGLALRVLDFLANNSHSEGAEDQTHDHQASRGQRSRFDDDETSVPFWDASDVPVESRNCLNASTSQDSLYNNFVRPPSNLVVLEGDCLDVSPDGEELDSFLLGTTNLYRDFLLLDSFDTVTVDSYLKESELMNSLTRNCKGNFSRKSFVSPVRKSGGSERQKKQGLTYNKSPEVENCNKGSDPFIDDNHVSEFADPCFGSSAMDDSESDEDNPWKPLNPHKAGTLNVRPFAKVKGFRRNRANSDNPSSLTSMFPLAKVNGTINPELSQIWERRCGLINRGQNTKSLSLYEQLRQTLENGNHRASETWSHSEPEDNDFDNINDWRSHDNINDNLCNDVYTPTHQEKYDTNANNKSNEPVEPISQTNLEDLCRSHLDALLANIAETEKQADLTARVSSWKQKIEHNLEEQESRTPFDIHYYGEKILTKLSLESDKDSCLSFSEMVLGQEKHDVARTFSALLQLVNNGEVQLDRSDTNGEPACYSAANSFSIHLQPPGQERANARAHIARKRVKSPLKKEDSAMREKLRSFRSSSPVASSRTCKLAVKIGRAGSLRCTPDGKRRRRSRLI